LPEPGRRSQAFCLGQVQQFSIDVQQRVLQPRAWFQEWFVQDDWESDFPLERESGSSLYAEFSIDRSERPGSDL